MIFNYLNYRKFLSDRLVIELKEGKTYRHLSKEVGMSTPNFFQQVISGQRNLTELHAKKIAVFLSLSAIETEYLVLMSRLLRDSYKDKEAILEKMQQMIRSAKINEVYDQDFHSHWLHQVVFEMATAKGLGFTKQKFSERLKHLATSDEVQNSLDFLLAKGYLSRTDDGRYMQENVKFSSPQNIRNIDIRRNHLRFLDMAKHRVHADIFERSFQGLTIAMPARAMPDLNERLARLVDEIDLIYNSGPDADTVVRLQLCAFQVTTPPTA